MQPFLTIDQKTGLLRIEGKGQKIAEVATISEFNLFHARNQYSAYWSSSTLDFPEQYTNNAGVIALAKHIRKERRVTWTHEHKTTEPTR